MPRTLLVVVAALAMLLITVAPIQAKDSLVQRSDAESILILHAFLNGYWWDHTDLTVAVNASPNVDPTLLQATHDAIATWNTVLVDQFGGLITLTDVTAAGDPAHNADIVLHYVPHAGGLAFAGKALCVEGHCQNVLVSSHFAQYPAFTYELVYWIALHELGHALGLGHAEPLLETTDLMGYGWIYQGVAPVLSTCDIAGLAVVFAWALEGAEPYPPTVASVDCGSGRRSR